MSSPLTPIRTDRGTPRLLTVLERDARAVGHARRELARYLDGRLAPARLDDVLLVLSELVTNALQHGLGRVVVNAAIDGDDLRMSVSDSGDGEPMLRPRDLKRLGGLGLHIVDEVAASWGTAPYPGGKAVWVIIHTGG